jgi:pimeloyl-ACP methyl ester carboxylesterase
VNVGGGKPWAQALMEHFAVDHLPPMLIMAGDDDLVAVEHLEALRAGVRDGQLATMPGTTHALPLEKTDLVAGLI